MLLFCVRVGDELLSHHTHCVRSGDDILEKTLCRKEVLDFTLKQIHLYPGTWYRAHSRWGQIGQNDNLKSAKYKSTSRNQSL